MIRPVLRPQSCPRGSPANPMAYKVVAPGCPTLSYHP